MGKKCIICGQEAEFVIKNSSEAYCKDCAIEHFNDLSYLQKIEDEAKRLHKLVKEKGNF